MSADEEEVIVPILWSLLLNIEEDEKQKRMWVHPLNKKRTTNNLIKCFLRELRNDDLKFKNFTRVSPETFDYILNIISEEIQKADTNFRKSIKPDEQLLVTLW